MWSSLFIGCWLYSLWRDTEQIQLWQNASHQRPQGAAPNIDIAWPVRARAAIKPSVFTRAPLVIHCFCIHCAPPRRPRPVYTATTFTFRPGYLPIHSKSERFHQRCIIKPNLATLCFARKMLTKKDQLSCLIVDLSIGGNPPH